jgi:hypothetical protein
MMTRSRHVCALRALRIHPQSCVTHETFPQWRRFSHRKGCPGGPFAAGGTESPCRCFSWIDTTDEARVKSDLQKVRELAEARLKSGSVPNWSWPQHVQLIEAVDAMLHDISVAETAPQTKRYTGSPLRLVTANPAKSDTRRKTGSMR